MKNELSVKKAVPLIVKAINQIQCKPQLYVKQENSEDLESYIWGFRQAAHLFGHMAYWEKHLRLIEQIAYERGWPMNVDFATAMRKKGLEEDAIIKNILDIEIESWQRLENILPDE